MKIIGGKFSGENNYLEEWPGDKRALKEISCSS
jgi:hypothetical protein